MWNLKPVPMKSLLKNCASAVGYEIRRKPDNRELLALEALDFLRGPADSRIKEFVRFAYANHFKSSAQLFQDLLVLFILREKRNGYFVEFGAADGQFLSNTFLLEQEYAWKGILAEPSHAWQAPLRRNRTCDVDGRCVWHKSGQKLLFSQTINAEYSTLSKFRASDFHDRAVSIEYTVITVSLNDLLEQHNAPSQMDYLSIDTEGSEFAILESLDFRKWKFRVITVEHNYQPQRNDIHSLLSAHGYNRLFTSISQFDDWYILGASA
jgi:FkbM family methyltransferase